MQMAPRGMDCLYPLIALFQSVGEHCLACGGIWGGVWSRGGGVRVDTHSLGQAEDMGLNVTAF